jgi:hypothetical protein
VGVVLDGLARGHAEETLAVLASTSGLERLTDEIVSIVDRDDDVTNRSR